MEDNVPGFIGYPITREGELYSRRVERSPHKFGKWHKLRLSKKVRVKVRLYKDGMGYDLSISRLVALVYVYNPNPSRFNEVMHLDNKRSITLFIELKSETLWNKDFLLYYIT